MMLAAVALLEENPDPTEEEIRWAISGQHLPLHRLPEHRQGGPVGGGSEAERECGMSAMETAAEEHSTGWLGNTVKRKEDDRFIRGRGNYVDDIVLPRHAAHGDPAQPARPRPDHLDRHLARPRRCPAWSRSSPASCWPQHNLAWMPTLSGDTQAVLATDKVRFQGQEVAGVVAEDPYVAARRARADRRRLRAAAGGDDPAAGARSRARR